MGVMGRYIDALNDDERDRVIQGKNWTDGVTCAFEDEGGEPFGCLVGHARGCVERREFVDLHGEQAPELDVACAFDDAMFRAVQRPGARPGAQDRIVRAIKLRAGKPHRVNTAPVQKHEAAQV